VNKIKELMAAGAKILGLPDTFRHHSLHAVGVTKLANDSSISIAKVCHTTCHSTASTSKMYQKTDGISEANCLHALGFTLPTEPVPISAAEARRASEVTRANIVHPPVMAESKSEGLNKSAEHIEYMDVSAAVALAELQDDGNVSDGDVPCLLTWN
jgi:hypothetical protein